MSLRRVIYLSRCLRIDRCRFNGCFSWSIELRIRHDHVTQLNPIITSVCMFNVHRLANVASNSTSSTCCSSLGSFESSSEGISRSTRSCITSLGWISSSPSGPSMGSLCTGISACIGCIGASAYGEIKSQLVHTCNYSLVIETFSIFTSFWILIWIHVFSATVPLNLHMWKSSQSNRARNESIRFAVEGLQPFFWQSGFFILIE